MKQSNSTETINKDINPLVSPKFPNYLLEPYDVRVPERLVIDDLPLHILINLRRKTQLTKVVSKKHTELKSEPLSKLKFPFLDHPTPHQSEFRSSTSNPQTQATRTGGRSLYVRTFLPLSMYLTATSSLVRLSLTSLATPKLPAPSSFSASYLSSISSGPDPDDP